MIKSWSVNFFIASSFWFSLTRLWLIIISNSSLRSIRSSWIINNALRLLIIVWRLIHRDLLLLLWNLRYVLFLDKLVLHWSTLWLRYWILLRLLRSWLHYQILKDLIWFHCLFSSLVLCSISKVKFPRRYKLLFPCTTLYKTIFLHGLVSKVQGFHIAFLNKLIQQWLLWSWLVLGLVEQMLSQFLSWRVHVIVVWREVL